MGRKMKKKELTPGHMLVETYARKEWLLCAIYVVLRKCDPYHRGMTLEEIYCRVNQVYSKLPAAKETELDISTVETYLDDLGLRHLAGFFFPGEIQESSESRSMQRALKDNNSQDRQVRVEKAAPQGMDLDQKGLRYCLRGDLPDEVWRLVMDFLGSCPLLSDKEALRYRKVIGEKYCTDWSLPLGEVPQREGMRGVLATMARLRDCVRKRRFATLVTRHRTIRDNQLGWADGETLSHVCVADVRLDEQQRPVALVLREQEGRWEKILLPVKQIAKVLPERENLPEEAKEQADVWKRRAQDLGVREGKPVKLNVPEALLGTVEDICIGNRACLVKEHQEGRCVLQVLCADPDAVAYLTWKYYPEIWEVN